MYADIRIDAEEVKTIMNLAADHAPVYRNYQIDIYDDSGVRIAEVKRPYISVVKNLRLSFKINRN